MTAFTRLTSKAVPLLLDDVDTDIITPIGRVLQGREAMVKYAFEPLRFDETGAPRADCPLNDPVFQGAEILLAGANFGCGSSRETAAWAVKALGFRAVVATGFGAIFESNCFRNGILPVSLPSDAVRALAETARDGGDLSLDLDARSVDDGRTRLTFPISDFRREGLLRGVDELDLILGRLGDIAGR